MTRVVLVALALLSLPAIAQTKSRRVAAQNLDLSQAAPTTTNPQAGASTAYNSTSVPGALRLTGCLSYQVTLCALTGSISATGSLQIYYWPDPATGVAGNFTPTFWSRNKGIDESVPTTVATDCAGGVCPCITFPTRPTSGFGWVYAAPASVTTTGGMTQVKVIVEAICST